MKCCYPFYSKVLFSKLVRHSKSPFQQVNSVYYYNYSGGFWRFVCSDWLRIASNATIINNNNKKHGDESTLSSAKRVFLGGLGEQSGCLNSANARIPSVQTADVFPVVFFLVGETKAEKTGCFRGLQNSILNMKKIQI